MSENTVNTWKARLLLLCSDVWNAFFFFFSPLSIFGGKWKHKQLPHLSPPSELEQPFLLLPQPHPGLGLSNSGVWPLQVWLISGGEQQPFIIQEWIGEAVSTPPGREAARQADSRQNPDWVALLCQLVSRSVPEQPSIQLGHPDSTQVRYMWMTFLCQGYRVNT